MSSLSAREGSCSLRAWRQRLRSEDESSASTWWGILGRGVSRKSFVGVGGAGMSVGGVWRRENALRRIVGRWQNRDYWKCWKYNKIAVIAIRPLHGLLFITLAIGEKKEKFVLWTYALENLISDAEKNQVTSKHERSDHSNGDAIEVNHEYVLSSSHMLNDAHRSNNYYIIRTELRI